MRLWTHTGLRLLAGTYFVLTSLYCLLAYLPYTYYFLIKAPAYAWMPWFARHQAILYWIAALGTLATERNGRVPIRNRDRMFWASAAALVAAGIFVTFRPFLAQVDDSRSSYWWSLASLGPLVLASVWKSRRASEDSSAVKNRGARLFSYSAAVITACAVSVVYLAGARLQLYRETHSARVHAADAEYVAWSLLSHIILALAVFSVLNLVGLLARKTSRPRVVQTGINGALIFAALWIVLFHFLDSALSFSGWAAQVYSASFALALTLWGFAAVRPFLESVVVVSEADGSGQQTFAVGTWVTILAASLLAIVFPYIIGEADWSGFLESAVTLLLWVVVGVCVFRLRPARVNYSFVLIIGVVIGSAAAYKGLQASEIFWSRPLGATDDEISLTLEAYGGHDNSFLLAHHILGNSRNEVCGDLCRILRENTNVRDTRARVDIRLVDQLVPAQGERPNIFVFVVDSMRSDYLGAYNPKVDYTPNLDAFARESVVFHNVYSQYAGTSLSEPAIWSGAMLLHAHYLQPFSKLNSLDTMLHTDGYRKIVSEDEVLSAIMPADDDVVKLDTDKKLWNQIELGSTLRQAEAVLDRRQSAGQPVFLYAQPKNVHQFARNDVPSPTSQHWPDRPGMMTRITYEVHWVDSCLGQFFNYLKQRGMYDNSIIIVTSDHGDATGELGRISHSTVIWPEIMRVPLMIHLPAKMRKDLVYDDSRIATLTDLTPTLYYLLGHRPIRQNPLYGHPLFATSQQELKAYPAQDLLLASDVRAVYGILTADGRYLYTTYDSPAQSYLFDLIADPNAQRNILTPNLKQKCDEEIIQRLQAIGDYYKYKPGVESLLTATSRAAE